MSVVFDLLRRVGDVALFALFLLLIVVAMVVAAVMMVVDRLRAKPARRPFHKPEAGE